MNDTAAVATFAAEVAKVINSKAEWKAKVAWRKPLSDAFKKRYAFTCTHSSCRLCRYAYARKHGLGWNHEGSPQLCSHKESLKGHSD